MQDCCADSLQDCCAEAMQDCCAEVVQDCCNAGIGVVICGKGGVVCAARAHPHLCMPDWPVKPLAELSPCR